MSTLLGHLAQWGGFSFQGEVLCTQGLCYLLKEYEEAGSALAAEIEVRSGIEIGKSLSWRSEAFDPSFKDRPDLEASGADGTPVIEIEAKLGASFGQGQLESYIKRFAVDRPSVLVVLVPRPRVKEAVELVTRTFEAFGPGPCQPAKYPHARVIVVSWDEVLAKLRQSSSPRLVLELEQFDAMYRVLSGYDIRPLAGREELLRWGEREADFVNLVERVSKALTTHHKLYPMGLEPLEQVPEGLEPRGYRRRYVCMPLGDARPCFSLGTRDPFERHDTPIWMRFHSKTARFPLIKQRLMSSVLGPKVLDIAGGVWIPLDVPVGKEGEEMFTALLSEAEEVIGIAYGDQADNAEAQPQGS